MHARAVDEASEGLSELRSEEWQDLSLAAVALALAVAATAFFPSLRGPLFLGGLAVGVRGVRALWRRWELVDRLAGDRDAHTISEVRAYASREATLERRRRFAALIHLRLENPADPRVAAVAEELGALASELEDPALALDPASAVACARLLDHLASSPSPNPALTAPQLQWRVRQIRSGFGSLACPA